MSKDIRPNKVYKYKEIPSSDGSIAYGWSSDDLEINFDLPVVISTLSKSKYVTESDMDWSKQEGVTAAYLSDYRSYFESSTGDTVESFLEKWDGVDDEVLNMLVEPDSEREDRGRFLVLLAKLIRDGNKFSMYGRVYKLVSKNT
jgi:hypothetical protein